MWKKFERIFRKHWKRMIYYAGIAAVLMAVAFCAERYRYQPKSEMMATQSKEAEEVPTEEPAPEPFILPETAEILRGYADVPIWNAALGCFETHTGTDIAFADGIARSLCAGVVRAVDGDSIRIDAGEWTLRVTGVEAISVESGTEIAWGDPIGTQGNGTAQEVWLPPHSHYQITRNNKTVDLERIVVKSTS